MAMIDGVIASDRREDADDISVFRHTFDHPAFLLVKFFQFGDRSMTSPMCKEKGLLVYAVIVHIISDSATFCFI